VADELVRFLVRFKVDVVGGYQLILEVATKQLELTREVVRKALSVGVLYAPAVPYATNELRDLDAAAHALGLALRPCPREARSPVERQPGENSMRDSEVTINSLLTRLFDALNRHDLGANRLQLEPCSPGGNKSCPL
jgi:hypothetical protein